MANTANAPRHSGDRQMQSANKQLHAREREKRVEAGAGQRNDPRAHGSQGEPSRMMNRTAVWKIFVANRLLV